VLYIYIYIYIYIEREREKEKKKRNSKSRLYERVKVGEVQEVTKKRGVLTGTRNALPPPTTQAFILPCTILYNMG